MNQIKSKIYMDRVHDPVDQLGTAGPCPTVDRKHIPLRSFNPGRGIEIGRCEMAPTGVAAAGDAKERRRHSNGGSARRSHAREPQCRSRRILRESGKTVVPTGVMRGVEMAGDGRSYGEAAFFSDVPGAS